MSTTRNLADFIVLLKQSNGNPMYEMQLMSEINSRLYEITDPALKSLLSKYVNSPSTNNQAKF